MTNYYILFPTKIKYLPVRIYIYTVYYSTHGDSPVALGLYFSFRIFSLSPCGNFGKNTGEELIPIRRIEDQVKNWYETEISRDR